MGAIIDAHCHLDFEAFDADRDTVLAAAAAAGIERIVIPGVDIGNWARITSLCEQHDRLSACYGLHPYRVDQHREQDLQELERMAASPACVAVGECGLDYREGMAERERQRRFFSAQLDIAAALDKPVVIHSVRATADVIEELQARPAVRGMVHAYSGSYEQAMQLHRMGLLLSFGGAITYPRATRLRDTVSRLPLNALLVETDAPDQPDAAHHGERNEPAYITSVIDTLCELRDEDRDTLTGQLHANTVALFNL